MKISVNDKEEMKLGTSTQKCKAINCKLRQIITFQEMYMDILLLPFTD